VSQAPDQSDRRLAQLITAGDDYEVLAAVPTARVADLRAATGAAGVPVAEIGRVVAGAGLTVVSSDGRLLPVERSGWDHF
jgi:thiamine-monophosphate kinase